MLCQEHTNRHRQPPFLLRLVLLTYSIHHCFSRNSYNICLNMTRAKNGKSLLSAVCFHLPQRTPLLFCLQKSGSASLPRDMKSGDKALKRPHHPMRTVEDFASRMPNATVFSTLDARSGFWQIKLDHESSLLTTFSIPFGRFRILRMPFGITSASEVFQHAMEELFAGYPCAIIVDDLLVSGEGTADHDVNLKKVLERAREAGMKLAPKKCKFHLNQLSYVGHQFTNGGLKPDEAKVAAIKEMPTPDGPEALRRFLGMTNYLHKFISNFSEKTAPLRELLRNDVHWSWEPAHNKLSTPSRQTSLNLRS